MCDACSTNTEKYSKIVAEIETFIEAKRKKPTKVKGIVKNIDLSNNILTVRLESIKPTNLSSGSLILIRGEDPFDTYIRAFVRDIHNSNLKIEVKTDPSQFENKKVVIDTNTTNVILKRLETVVKKIKSGKISLDNARILDLIIGKGVPQYSERRVDISGELNKSQKEAVVKSIESDDFHLVIGPPGTGKTYVIEELIRQFSKNNQKILITAWTNLAVDNIIKRLKSDAKKVVRIGSIDKIDPEVRKCSIFEKMKEHKDWNEVERHNKLIDELSKSIPKVKDEIKLVKGDINQCLDKKKILNKKLGDRTNEKQKYENIIATPIDNEGVTDFSAINDEMLFLGKKSEACLSVSKNILQMNKLEELIPEVAYIQNLKKTTRTMRISIFGKKVFFILHKDNKELKKLKQEYEKNREHLDEILELQRKCNILKEGCEKEFYAMYPDGKGHPDKEALNIEFGIYKLLENKYLPSIKKQDTLNLKRRLSEINQEVHRLYLDSIRKKIELLNVKINGLNIKLYIQINHKEDLNRQYENISYSLEFYKSYVDTLMRNIIFDIIDSADLIAATAVSSCHYFLDDTEFDIMIMDEASQVASFMSLLPLSKCKKFVLVGDNRQLQPIEEEYISKEMNLSIFNRLFEMYPDVSTLLTIQYRMHKTIAQIASEIFYEERLRTSENVAERILSLNAGTPQFLDSKIPAVFIDTSNVEYYEDEIGSGCSNTKEAKYVAYIVSLFIKNGIEPETIGVVTPYVKQKRLIREKLEVIGINGVEVDTVHKFQGREKDIIVMSFARSKRYSVRPYQLRFIENETIVNVAITRAKKKLILVGNSQTLCQSNLLRRVFSKIGRGNTTIL
jgi:superfamily I DNA and/or RNA helicase